MRPSRARLRVVLVPLALAGGTVAQAQGLELEHGRALYVQHCASCHSAELEGQPGWRSPGPDGTYPAPPHSAEGHTWHHADAMLIDYVKRGGQAVLDGMGVEFASGMPSFGDVLTDAEIGPSSPSSRPPGPRTCARRRRSESDGPSGRRRGPVAPQLAIGRDLLRLQPLHHVQVRDEVRGAQLAPERAVAAPSSSGVIAPEAKRASRAASSLTIRSPRATASACMVAMTASVPAR